MTEGFILTSNRDERIARATSPPAAYSINDHSVFFPKDLEAGGTWIAASDHGRVCCLLNGAFELHERKSTYKRSRGRIVTEVFEYLNVSDFFKAVDLIGVEPFTLIVLESLDVHKLYEFRWDGIKKHLTLKNHDTPHIWSSVTLYNRQIRAIREKCFAQWVKQQNTFEADRVLSFHSDSLGVEPEYDMVMERNNGIKTVSITQIVLHEPGFSMIYEDLSQNRRSILSKRFEREYHA